MSEHTISVGAVEITSVSDGTLSFETGGFFPSVPEEAWTPYRDELTPEGGILLNIGSFVLRSEGRNVLIDTGLGPVNRGLDADCGYLLDNLGELQVTRDEVDFVVLTHVHPDHVGWNLLWEGADARPAFPKARYLVPKADWDVRRAADEGTTPEPGGRAAVFREQVEPLERLGQLDLFEGERAVTGEITTLPTPGHTPGHMCILVSSQGERALIMGDLAHLPLQVHETAWSPRADVDPALSVASRRAALDRVEREDGVLVAGHFPAPGFGRLVRLEGRRYWRAL